MARRRSHSKVKLDKNLIVSALIAGVIVDVAPTLLNNYLFKSSPLSGIALTGASAGVGYVAGMLMKKPDVSNIAIAFAVSQIVSQTVSGFLPAPASTTSTKDFIGLTPGGNVVLSDYTNSPGVMSPAEYATSYPLTN